MTARKDLKRLIRQRMLRTGESYMAARRHFLIAKESHMTNRLSQTSKTLRDLPIDRLQLTLKTTRTLRNVGVERTGQLIDAISDERNPLGLDSMRLIEVRDVLASRGL